MKYFRQKLAAEENAMTIEVLKQPSWWGHFTVAIDKSRQWQTGPLKFIVRRLQNEWQIAYERITDFDINEVNWSISDTDQLPDSLGDKSRYIFQGTSEQLTITPKLADRPIISRPLTPFNLTAGEEVILYVSSPLWIELAIDDSADKVLQEIAIQRLSDTWFGPSTLEGELCYAATTHCRLNLEEQPHRPHRAITPVHIRNQADTTLSVERLNLPAPFLSLYASSNGQLWTPQITLLRKKDGDIAELEINNTLPEDAQPMVLLSEPREKASSHTLFRAFNAVFS